MSRFLSEKYRVLEAYTPGEQPRDKQYIKLNTNESPFPPSPKVIEAINRQSVEDLRLYPDPEGKVLKEKLAEQFAVESKNIFLSNGSDDILNFSFMAFFASEKSGVAFPDISYGFYRVYAELHGVDYVTIPLKEDFTICPEEYRSIGRGVVIANPNAPTGIALTRGEIEQIVASNPDHVVLIDEAYVDCGGESAAELVNRSDNLLVVRTFSKSCSLAGGRLGFAIGHEELIADLEKIKYSTNPYNINRLTMLAGIASLEDVAYYRNNCHTIMENRQYLTEELRRRGFEVLDSKANFVFAASRDIDGAELYRELRSRGILVRHFGAERICNYNRITIGTMKEMIALVMAVDDIFTASVAQRGD